ncbi:hypothetical protein SAMN02787118_111344 [Streptomyces mirabilis]|jgi:hypothetical protein|uniref:Uncharacterized protein n=1 Tax=Streptomyces mirabilis TaxID=68239 RepID=A0A1I2LA97_9ACTN|nr:hypothetical protein [Streptomyces mirabilis]SFF75913.1 hypothetical protein SAMN02787118_111344 [Streptomyces mirabilis]
MEDNCFQLPDQLEPRKELQQQDRRDAARGRSCVGAADPPVIQQKKAAGMMMTPLTRSARDKSARKSST